MISCAFIAIILAKVTIAHRSVSNLILSRYEAEIFGWGRIMRDELLH
jgi:hypothetical protein